jgi:2-polyprenyl-3-methyl-5-hydroxy-6-metoxy-1,4-benzoquinol methylase
MFVDDELARRSWDEAADAWDDFVETGLDYYRTELHGPALLAACEPLAGRDVLDLGCGQGWFTRQLARAGARAVGIDWSERLIAHALRHEAAAPLGARYQVLDAARSRELFSPASFDIVTACMSLMDMPRPGAVLAAARPLLRPGGRIVASVPNPVTDSSFRVWERDAEGNKLALKIDRYFAAKTSVMEWNMKRLARGFRTVQYRHTLEQWSRMIEKAGLHMARMREPRPGTEAIDRCPDLDDASRVPYFLVLDLRSCPP